MQTGKALRASRKDARGNLTHVPGTSQSKLPETIRLFHSALDELEVDIVSNPLGLFIGTLTVSPDRILASLLLF